MLDPKTEWFQNDFYNICFRSKLTLKEMLAKLSPIEEFEWNVARDDESGERVEGVSENVDIGIYPDEDYFILAIYFDLDRAKSEMIWHWLKKQILTRIGDTEVIPMPSDVV